MALRPTLSKFSTETEMSESVPAEVFSPGDYLKEELESRGWTQVELSEILGRPPRLISEIVAAKRAITPETAKGLAAALGTSAELWMNLESRYRLATTKLETSAVSRRARLYSKFPVKEMIRRGWVADADSLTELEKNFCEYFGIASPDETPIFRHAAKKHRYDGPDQALQLAWLIRAECVAREVKAAAFSAEALRAAVEQLKDCLSDVEDIRRVPGLLVDAGVRFVVVEFLPGAKLDGACFWVDRGRSPVIVLSLRLDRLDNFWHTLFHEIDHILNGEGKDSPVVDCLEMQPEGGKGLPTQERRANQAAANYCIDRGALDLWLTQTSRAFSRKNIITFAHRVHVHPALVVGQLQYRGIIPYSFHRDLLVKIRSLVLETAIADGFDGR
jgi:HTH-type transcriptional regulator/antitoxin HigA